MKTINWKTATDAEKNACFHENIVGKPAMEYVQVETGYCVVPEAMEWRPSHFIPDYLHSADAVLPWLEKQKDAWMICGLVKGAAVGIGSDGEKAYAEAGSIPEAAMIALLRAKGVEVHP